MEACNGSNYYILDHFVLEDKMVSIGSNTKRNIKDYKLSRYACYLIVQNCNPRITIIALAQTYFAIQTRKQELSDNEYNVLTEDEKRIYRRNQVRKGNYNLNKTVINSGVKDLARFHNAGYKGLYNGETADDIAKRKKLRYREDILDNMESEELADNIFRIAQTDAKLKRDNVDNEYKIKVDNTYNYIDLLSYNIKFKCYVVIKLKITELKKEHTGQIQIYKNIDNC